MRIHSSSEAGVGLVLFCAVLLGVGSSSCVRDTACAPQAGKEAIDYFSPRSFPDLPGNITDFLEEQGYTIPQCYLSEKPVNVISGAFAKPGQVDWAVLASKDGVSSILVFWGGATENVAQLASKPDNAYLQQIYGAQQSFFRLIRAVDREFIVRHAEAYGGPEVPEIDHEGIEDAFFEKASIVHYLQEGSWFELTGAD